MKIYKILLLLIVLLLGIGACSKFVIVENRYGVKRGYKKSSRGVVSSYSPFVRLSDTALTGYKLVYSITDIPTGQYIFDTIPFCRDGKPVGERVYEIYYYKGQPRLTKEVGYFSSDGFCRKTKYITDIERWNKQIELGLENLPPDFETNYPSLSNNFEIDNNSNYTTDDIAYVLKGKIEKKTVKYFNQKKADYERVVRFDSLFTYLRKDGVRNLYANADRKNIWSPELASVLFWYSDFSCDLSKIKVASNENVNTFFGLIPDSLLNSESYEFRFDTLAYKATGIKVNPECYKTYISIKFKDGNYKTWAYYKCGIGERFNTLSNYPFMKKFTDDIDSLNFIQQTCKEFIDADFTLGDICLPNSIDVEP